MKSVKRIVDTDFWNDEKVLDYTPEEKYFFQFLLTNPNTRQSGIYKLPIKMAAFWTGYNADTIERLLYRFENELKLIVYSRNTQEVAILNYLKYAVMKGGKPVNDCIIRDLSTIKDKDLIVTVNKHMEEYFKNLPEDKIAIKQIGEIFKNISKKSETTLFNVASKTNTVKNSIPYQVIIDYLNGKQPNKRAYNITSDTKKCIRARWEELSGQSREYKLKYFFMAIDHSFKFWTKKDGLQNMRPGILFNGQMESRVNGDAYGWDKPDTKDPAWLEESLNERSDKDEVIAETDKIKTSNLDLDEVSRRFANL